MKYFYIAVSTALGNFCMIVERNSKGIDTVIASGFGSARALAQRIGFAEKLVQHKGEHPFATCVQKYFAGEARALRGMRMRQSGSAFEEKVWSAIKEIKYGKTETYKSIAAAIGNPRAVRAVGSACGKNKLIVLVPCHRVLRSDGGLGGYVYGSKVKVELLARERK